MQEATTLAWPETWWPTVSAMHLQSVALSPAKSCALTSLERLNSLSSILTSCFTSCMLAMATYQHVASSQQHQLHTANLDSEAELAMATPTEQMRAARLLEQDGRLRLEDITIGAR